MSKRTLSDSELHAHTKNRHAQNSLQKKLQELQHKEFQLRDCARVEIQKWRLFQKENVKNSGWSAHAMRPEAGDGDVFYDPPSPDGLTSPSGRKGVGRYQRPWAYSFNNKSHNKVYKELEQASENNRRSLRNVGPANTASPRYLLSSNDNSALTQHPKLAMHVSAVTGLERAKSAWGRGEKILGFRTSDLPQRPFKSAREHTSTELLDLSQISDTDSGRKDNFQRQVSKVQILERARSAWTQRDRKPCSTSASPRSPSDSSENRLARSVTALNGLQKSVSVWICSACGGDKWSKKEERDGDALKRTVAAYKGVRRAKSALDAARSSAEEKVFDESQNVPQKRRSRCSCGCISINLNSPVSTPSKGKVSPRQSKLDLQSSASENSVPNKAVTSTKSIVSPRNAKGKPSRNQNVQHANVKQQIPLENPDKTEQIKEEESKLPISSSPYATPKTTPTCTDTESTVGNSVESRIVKNIISNKSADLKNGSPELVTGKEKEETKVATELKTSGGKDKEAAPLSSDNKPSVDRQVPENSGTEVPAAEPSSRFVRVYKELSKLPDDVPDTPENTRVKETDNDVTSNDFPSSVTGDRQEGHRSEDKLLTVGGMGIPGGETRTENEINKEESDVKDEGDKSLQCIQETDEGGQESLKNDDVDASVSNDKGSATQRQSRRPSEISTKGDGEVKKKLGSIVSRWNSRASDLGRGLKTSSSKLSITSAVSLDEDHDLDSVTTSSGSRKFSTVSRDSRRRNSTLFRPIAQRVKKTVAAKTADGFFYQVARVLLAKSKERRAARKEAEAAAEAEISSTMTQDKETAIARGKERVGMRFLRKQTAEYLGFDTSAESQSRTLSAESSNDVGRKDCKEKELSDLRQDTNNNISNNDKASNSIISASNSLLEKRRLQKSFSVTENSHHEFSTRQNHSFDECQGVLNDTIRGDTPSQTTNANDNNKSKQNNENKLSAERSESNDDDDKSSVNIISLLRDRDVTVALSRGVLDYDNKELEKIGGSQNQTYHKGVRIKNYISPQLRYKSAAKDRKKKGVSVRWHAAAGASVTAHQCQDELSLGDTFFPKQARQRELAKLIADNHTQPANNAAQMADAALKARIDSFLQSVEPYCKTPTPKDHLKLFF